MIIIHRYKSNANKLIIQKLTIQRVQTITYQQSSSILHSIHEVASIRNAHINQRFNAFSVGLSSRHISLEVDVFVVLGEAAHLEALLVG